MKQAIIIEFDSDASLELLKPALKSAIGKAVYQIIPDVRNYKLNLMVEPRKSNDSAS